MSPYYPPLPVRGFYHIEGYGLHGPVVDGLLLAREQIEASLPIQIEHRYWDDDDESMRTEMIDNHDRSVLLVDIDKRIEEVKRLSR